MPVQPEKFAEVKPFEDLGSLSGCLVEGDAEQRQREKRVRRRALAISIALQSAVLTVLVLVPLFAKTERIAVKEYVPLPPIGRPGPVRQNRGERTRQTTTTVNQLHFWTVRDFSHPVRQGGSDPGQLSGIDPIGDQTPGGDGCTGCLIPGIGSPAPRPPAPPENTPAKTHRLREPSINPAMLIYRVEPLYPELPKQLHREGRVELHAIIGTDGTIQSLQVISGDPLFLRSALDAVQQWRYRPTILNGQPVEVDTTITVIYTLQH